MENMVKIASFMWPVDAHLLRMRLEAEGIPCFVFDENIVIMNWTLSNAVGGVKVLIRLEDLAKAREVLELDSGMEYSCPKCNSSHTFFDKFIGWLFAVSWWISVPLPFFKNKRVCKDCGYQWKIK